MNTPTEHEMPDIQDRLNTSSTPASPHYPVELVPDAYAAQPFDPSFAGRKEAFLAFIQRNPAPGGAKAPWYEIARLAAGGEPHTGILSAALDYIQARKDCADFALHAILRLIYQFKNAASLESLWDRVQQVVLGFKYWPDEPGIDAMCTWTENHYISFASAGYLAGQLYPDAIFDNSKLTGADLLTIHRSRLLRWLNLRFFTGFSEWLSPSSYDENLVALLNLVDFAEDDEIRLRAQMVIDLILFDIAINNLAGLFGSTCGRCNENAEGWSASESLASTCKLLFGRGAFSITDNMSAIAFALSRGYRMPAVLYAIANDQARPELLSRQRMGIQLSQASWWGLSPRNFEDSLHFLTMGAYLHPSVCNTFVEMLDAYNWWEKPHFSPIAQMRHRLQKLKNLRVLPWYARRLQKDLGRNTREETNLYTYRTPDYLLSTTQDYRKGFGGHQERVWQATLGPGAVCFTTHPSRAQGAPPNYWCGNGTLPRVAQIKNVVIAVYRISKKPALYVPNELFFSHAWLPRDQFDEIVETEGWVFARRGESYLALLSQHPYEWRSLTGQKQDSEIVVDKPNNIWLCELGSRRTDSDFSLFTEKILHASVDFYDERVVYHSPSQGRLQFGWKSPLRQDGRIISIKDYPRYGNPYALVNFPSEQVSIQFDEHTLLLDWINAVRQATGTI